MAKVTVTVIKPSKKFIDKKAEQVKAFKNGTATMIRCRVCYKDKPKQAFNGAKKYCEECAKYSTMDEESIQIEFFRLLRNEKAFKNLAIFHVPNGGLRNPRVAEKLKKAGTLKGVWDILGLVRNDKYVGFIIETKDFRGKTSKEQEAFELMVNPLNADVNYMTYIMKNPEQGIEFVKAYVNNKDMSRFNMDRG
jgi:hypothetical protein